MFIKLSRLWGSIRNIAQYLGFYIQVMTLIFSTATVYATTVFPYLAEHNILIPFWLFGLLVISVLLLISWFELKYTIPTFFEVWNDNWWNNHNPAKERIEQILKNQEEIIKRLKELK